MEHRHLGSDRNMAVLMDVWQDGLLMDVLGVDFLGSSLTKAVGYG